MYTKTLVLALVGSLFSLASAQSAPGCYLGAINSFDDPSNIVAVCKSSDAVAKIAEFCSGQGERDAALKAFKEVCGGKGVQVSTDIPSPTASGNVTPSGKGAPPTGSVSGGSTPTGSSSQGTGAAGKVEMGAAAVVVAGLALFL
ncbi:uncharacterized protein EI97DRAFT_436653 [Westerdykella ornata]|uniref:Extracellular membrane protein CFEM domain-containing protein n=1 Tax=Westerdykella ornata TaxID=318751 RepID=A0A6A6JC01_WESOR|nr:uncharacterized protein EI97DRAFT_436653 [Westerdykella ornata]KAF2272719.1 hypothetical protein EI97DRAFT_436653 [Westerdykella ornata]